MKRITKFHCCARPKLFFGLVMCAVAIVQLALIAPPIVASVAAARSTLYQNHRMGDLPATQSQADSQSMNYNTNTTATTASTTSANEPVSSLPDIVIDSIEDEISNVAKSVSVGSSGSGRAGNRHRYEQHPNSSTPTTQIDQGQQPDQQVDDEPVKLEARTQVDSLNSEQQQQQQQYSSQPQELIIIDHRPTTSSNDYSSTQSPPVSSTYMPPTSTMGHNQQQQQQQQQQHSSPQQQSGMITAPSQPVAQWTQQAPGKQAPTQQFYYQTSSQNGNLQQQQQQQQQQYAGSLMSGSSQMASVQHPTSINSIINEQQQPANQVQFTGTTVNGQPASLVYVSQPQGAATSANGMSLLPLQPGQPGQIMGIVQNGRRVSISNWLRGIGSMLANIFNRRDHGASALQQAMLASNQNGIIVQAPPPTPPLLQQQQQQQTGAPIALAQSTSGSGGWIQLGPNAPHWLTQAQSAIQQLQQGSNRFTTFIQAPQQAIAAASSLSALTVAPQQQAISTATYQQTSPVDLQASGSSNNYVSIQSPNGINLATNQPYQSGPIIVATQQQQQQQPPLQQIQQHQSSRQQPVASQVQLNSSPAAQQQIDQASKQQQQQQTLSNGQQQNQARFSRSSTPGVLAKQQAAGAQQQQQQQQQELPNGNLPLTHYSQYSTSMSSE